MSRSQVPEGGEKGRKDMSATQVIGFDLIALGLCVAYWEWRHRTYGWGRGWMHEPAHRLPPLEHPHPVDPNLVWGSGPDDHWHIDEEGSYRLRTIDLPLPPRDE
jgi:hypothetical protein